ncbi:uncharacterized protein LOC115094271 [Rhinatrema bivittatum]|uniref:uncharacterized protein LOC115094271 n=1 Tax=Rhinatrema bivittatum TaxID=194408 RepID=UPI00112C964E|nr:uncharacterized protein LOC115094271 [Rhinatrema bivittatum]
MAGRSRKPNFQEDEKEKLIRLVLPLEEILYPAGPRRGNIESRTEAWRSVRRAFNRQTCTARDLEALKAKFRQIRRMEPDLIKRVREELETAEESTSSEVANYGEVEQESQEQSLQLVHQDDHEEEEWLDPTDVQPATILRPSHRQQPEDLQGMLQQALRELQQVRRTQLREAHRWRAAYRGLTGEVRALRTELRSISCSIQQLVDRNSFPSEATD